MKEDNQKPTPEEAIQLEIWDSAMLTAEEYCAMLAKSARATTGLPYRGMAAVFIRSAIGCYANHHFESDTALADIRDSIVRDLNLTLSSGSVEHCIQKLKEKNAKGN